MTSWEMRKGRMEEAMEDIAAESVDLVLTDNPYGMGKITDLMALIEDWMAGGDGLAFASGGFMGQEWDKLPPCPASLRHAFRVLKPGGHLGLFSAPRLTWLVGLSASLAGFVQVDGLTWLYGQGFPHSYNVAKGVEGVLTTGSGSWTDWKNLDGEREEQGDRPCFGMTRTNAEVGNRPSVYKSTGKFELQPTTEEAKAAKGLGTALRPSHEDILIFRKPLKEKGYARQWLATGSGCFNVDACRTATNEDTSRTPAIVGDTVTPFGKGLAMGGSVHDDGRWPPNVILGHAADCTPEACAESCPILAMDGQQSGAPRFFPHMPHAFQEGDPFLYCPKPTPAEKEAGLRDIQASIVRRVNAGGLQNDPRWQDKLRKNSHTTVKPVALMRWLVRLLTPPQPDGSIPLVVDPFAGSGTTGCACVREGCRFIGVELDPFDKGWDVIARNRIDWWSKNEPVPSIEKPRDEIPGQLRMFAASQVDEAEEQERNGTA